MPKSNPKTQPDLKTKLQELYKSMSDWERKPVLQVGNIVVELIKTPPKQSKRTSMPGRLVLSIRRADSFRGIIIRGYSDIEDIATALNNDKIKEIQRALDELYLKKSQVIEFI